MALVCPDQKGEILLLQYIVGIAANMMGVSDNPVLHLYARGATVDDITPTDLTVISDLVEVSTLTGYHAITLASAGWTTVQASGVTTAVYSEQTFTFSTEATAYGYYVTNQGGDLLWLERFSGAPFRIPDGGGTISITTKLTLT